MKYQRTAAEIERDRRRYARNHANQMFVLKTMGLFVLWVLSIFPPLLVVTIPLTILYWRGIARDGRADAAVLRGEVLTPKQARNALVAQQNAEAYAQWQRDRAAGRI